jgi:hypothetical protein
MRRSEAHRRLSVARRLSVVVGVAVVLLLALVSPARSAPAEPPPSAKKTLVVGTHPIAPFVIKNADGTWSGISIDIWKRVAEELRLEYTIREYPVPQLLAPDETGIDVVISVNASSKNEEHMDVTHGFYSTGLAIATRTEPKSGIAAIARKVLTLNFLKGVGILALVLFMMGTIVWLVERGKKPDEFGGQPGAGHCRGNALDVRVAGRKGNGALAHDDQSDHHARVGGSLRRRRIGRDREPVGRAHGKQAQFLGLRAERPAARQGRNGQAPVRRLGVPGWPEHPVHAVR